MRFWVAMLCMLAAGGGLVWMRITYGTSLARKRPERATAALLGAAWLRDENGRFRWMVPAWLAFWGFCMFLAIAWRRLTQ
jgi:hypothetical protein